MKKFAVIGLGRFGRSVAYTLAKAGHEVIAIDRKEEIVQEIMDSVSKAVCLDSTDAKAMKTVGVENVDVAICSIGTDLASSVIVTLLLKELEVPVIICKAVSEQQRKVLEKIGASRVVLPERDMGERIANTLISVDEKVLDHINLPGNASIIEIIPPDDFVGKSLRDLDLRTRFGVNVIAIKKKEKDPVTGDVVSGVDVNVAPLADDILGKEDILVVFGEDAKIDELRKKG